MVGICPSTHTSVSTHTHTHTHTQTAAAYVLFYSRRSDQSRPTRRSVLDRSLSQSFAEEGKQLKAKYHGGNKEEDDQDKVRHYHVLIT